MKTKLFSDRGATAVEYGLIIALIAVVVIAAVALFGSNIAEIFGTAGSAIPELPATE